MIRQATTKLFRNVRWWCVAAQAGGIAEATPASLTAELTLRLHLWGRLEGVFYSAGRAVAGRSLLFQYGDGNFRSISSDFDGFQVKTDAEGRFAFPKVPPGKHHLVQLVEMKVSPGPIGRAHQPLSEVEIQSGQTTSVVLGGCTVAARLRWPAEVQAKPNWTVHAHLRPPMLIPPDDAKTDPAALTAWRT